MASDDLRTHGGSETQLQVFQSTVTKIPFVWFVVHSSSSQTGMFSNFLILKVQILMHCWSKWVRLEEPEH
jgi:hypothetical protein